MSCGRHFLFLLVFFFNIVTSVFPSCGLQSTNHEEPFLQGRIVGGSMSPPQSWPWIISIQRFNPKTGEYHHHCGGSLIQPSWAITAAHCVFRKHPNQFRLLLGPDDDNPQGKKTVYPNRIICHPNFVYSKFTDDIALVEFTEPVTYDQDISSVCLPPYSVQPGDFDHKLADKMATAIGWGMPWERAKVLPRYLHHVSVPVLTRRQCAELLFMYHPSWLCAGYLEGGKDACQGDSGGPLVFEMDDRWVLIGVISTGNGCARARRPGIYTSVALKLDWIHATINYFRSFA